jgi:hypothetical protein
MTINMHRKDHDMATVGAVARLLGVRPQIISHLFYSGRLRDDLCPVVSGRRLIPDTYVPQIEAALRRHGVTVRQQVKDSVNA